MDRPPRVKKVTLGRSAFSGAQGQKISSPIKAINGSASVDAVVKYVLIMTLVSGKLIQDAP